MTAMAPWWSTTKPTNLAPTMPEPRDEQDAGDWLDKLWADEDLAPAEPEKPEPEQEKPEDSAELPDDEAEVKPRKWFTPQAGYWPTPKLPSLPKAALSDGTKRLFYNVGAAGTGWAFGLVPTIGGWIAACGRDYSISAALVLGGGICLGVAAFWDRRTRHWYQPLAWVARIPLAAAVTALALYAPASQL
ncbi:hypothetical protein [Streptomyces sp. NPDC051704]|uniref:hypothetical protein n=1 Tax=Streptomyces TaxID=1883 RepID=UPI0037BB1F1F|nr:hypothetical protein OG592_44415 [Streptomyces avidinii]